MENGGSKRGGLLRKETMLQVEFEVEEAEARACHYNER
jgi:hypothetical protein